MATAEEKKAVRRGTLETMGRAPTLDELLNAKQPVYVRNNSNPRGQTYLTFVHPSGGKSKEILIPKTALPICISDNVSKQMLEESLSLRNLLQKNMLVLVWPKDALKELEDPDAQEEMKELYSSKFSGASKFSAGYKPTEEKKIDLADLSIVPDKEDEFKVNPNVQGIVAQLTSERNPITPKKGIRELKAIANTISDEDVIYVLQVAGKIPEVKAWVTDETERRRSSSPGASKSGPKTNYKNTVST